MGVDAADFIGGISRARPRLPDASYWRVVLARQCDEGSVSVFDTANRTQAPPAFLAS